MNADHTFHTCIVNKLLYCHRPRRYNKFYKNRSYGHCFMPPTKLLLLPRKPVALMLRQDLLHKCCISVSSHQQGISYRIMLITRGLGRRSNLWKAIITFSLILAMKGGDYPLKNISITSQRFLLGLTLHPVFMSYLHLISTRTWIKHYANKLA